MGLERGITLWEEKETKNIGYEEEEIGRIRRDLENYNQKIT